MATPTTELYALRVPFRKQVATSEYENTIQTMDALFRINKSAAKGSGAWVRRVPFMLGSTHAGFHKRNDCAESKHYAFRHAPPNIETHIDPV